MSALLEMLAKRSAAIKGASGNREKAITPESGATRYRILPSWRKTADGNFDSQAEFFHEFGQHFIKGVGETKPKAVYLCLSKTYGRQCPVCDKLAEGIAKSYDDDVINALKEAKAQGKYLFNVLMPESGDPNTPKILALPPTVAQQIFDNITEWGEEMISLTGGRDVIIERTGTGLSTKYAVRVHPKTTDVPAAVMNKIHDLDEWVKQENDEQERRALASIGAVAGLLAAPAGITTGSAPKPASTPIADFGSADEDDDALRTLEMAAPAAEGAPASAPAEAAPAAAAGADVDLDALLATL
ncbi:hypothetical protein [Chromobacterium sp. ASV23]|uniref:hypothetical protein n=1 Tax=Chromobacterium sp. ASV23 TaxID=2795110 RepID=UPI0018EBA67B|nr:hypothetical protein [Chromobacterium sp. ASV23]